VAWQLHYTSARSGLTSRAGFQFTAATPGLPPGVQATVAPYLSYRPPPDAPLSPGPDELAGFPIAFCYDQVAGHALLVRCRYLGRDYSGRYGNFLAHAIVAEPGELEGVRPIELWRAGCWRDEPGEGELPELDDLAPGDALDPGTLARWLAAGQEYGTLARLVDAVVKTFAQGHGRVTIVADDIDVIARWIAVVCYSLPAASAAALSFVTYTDDPGNAPYRLVGTTPGVWAAGARTAPAFVLDPPQAEAVGEHLGRYAQLTADCWREHDLAGLDALGELSGLGSGFDTAAALLALCRGDSTVTADEETAAARLLRRHGADIPAWVWRDLTPTLPRIGFELAAALCDLANGELAERCAARCVLLALADPKLRPNLPKRALAPGPRELLGPAFADAVAAAPGLAAVAAIVALADRCHVPLPASDVAAAAAKCGERGAGDLFAALQATPAGHSDDLLSGALTGLEAADPNRRTSMLTDQVCDLALGRDLTATPRVAIRVLSSVGRRRKARRVELTRDAIALEGPLLPAEIDAALRTLWSGDAPTVAECMALLDSWGPDSVAEAFARYPTLAGLPSRAFAAAREELETPEVVQLAARIGAVSWPDGSAAGTRADAAAVVGYAELARSAARSEAKELAKSLDRVAATQASPMLIDAAFAGIAARLARRPAEFRESLLAALTEPARARLKDRLAIRPERRKLFRRRGG
jgi:hypothetical protein